MHTASLTFEDELYSDSTEPQPLPATGHTPVTDAAVAPTDRQPGLTEGSRCGVCGEVLIAQETVSALWSYSDDGRTVIAYNGSEAELTIPEGVTALSANLFKNNTAVSIVHIPDAVQEVGDNTFFGATAITDIYFPDQLSGIKAATFYGVPAEARLHANAGSPTAVALSFFNRSFLTPEGWTLRYKTRSVTGAPTEVYIIGAPDTAAEVTVPADLNGVPVTQLHTGAYAAPAEAVHIPDSVTLIQDGAFVGTPAIYSSRDSHARTWAEANGLLWIHEPHVEEPIPAVSPTYANPGATAGVRCAVCGEILVAPEVIPALDFEPLGDSGLLLPASLIEIRDEAFQQLPIRILCLPDRLEYIGSGAFAECTNLSQVFIPASVTFIGEQAFAHRSEDLVIYGFAGTAAEAFAREAYLPFCPME